jgi:hypothetical protein
MFVDATLYHANAVNSNIKIKNHSYGFSANYIDSQAERDAVATSTAVGTIHLYAAGNERGTVAQDSNKQDVQSSPDVIAVAAFGSNGKFASYSSFGANVFVTTPSSTSGGFGITTTDRTGSNGTTRRAGSGDGDSFPDLSYTSTFGGTSSATPLASGVLALVKQVQPNLDVRFAKHLLARFSQLVDANDNTLTGGGDGATAGSAWKTNAAGLKFNQNYGFGLIHADVLTQQALLYTGVTPLQTATVPTTSVASAIPDNNLTGISRTFAFPSPPATPLEEVLITLDITHPFRGDVEVYLTSPSGTQSRMAYRSAPTTGRTSTGPSSATRLGRARRGDLDPPGAGRVRHGRRDLELLFRRGPHGAAYREHHAPRRLVDPAGREQSDQRLLGELHGRVHQERQRRERGGLQPDATGTIAGASVSGVSGSGQHLHRHGQHGHGRRDPPPGSRRRRFDPGRHRQQAGGQRRRQRGFHFGTVLHDRQDGADRDDQPGGRQLDPTNASPIQFTVTFSETVTNFTAGDVSFAGSTVGGTLVAAISGTGPYTVSVTGMTGNGVRGRQHPRERGDRRRGQPQRRVDQHGQLRDLRQRVAHRDHQPGRRPAGSDQCLADSVHGHVQRDRDGLHRPATSRSRARPSVVRWPHRSAAPAPATPCRSAE